MHVRWGIAMALLLAACSQEGTLVVQIRTDVAPGTGFARVRTTIDGVATPIEVGFEERRSWGTGARVAEVAGLPTSTLVLRVGLVDASGAVLVERPVRVHMEPGLNLVTVFLTADCVGVMCPLPGDAGDATACLAGVCVPGGCTEETPEACGLARCDTTASCPSSSVACAHPECSASGVCFEVLDHEACGDGAICDPAAACVPIGCPDLDGDGLCDDVDPDQDGDGVENAADCAPLDPSTYPGAPELCDGLDNDCSEGGGPLADPNGLFVSAGAPPPWVTRHFTTVADALAATTPTRRSIYVASGTYDEVALSIAAGPTVFIKGGRDGDCDYGRAGDRSLIRAPDRVITVEPGGDLFIEDLDVHATAGAGGQYGAVVTSGTLRAVRVGFTTEDDAGLAIAFSAVDSTVTFQNVDAQPGISGSGSSAALSLVRTDLTATGGRFVTLGGSASRTIGLTDGSLSLDGPWIENAATDDAVGILADSGAVQLTNAVVVARGAAVSGVGLQLMAGVTAHVAHTYVSASADTGTARGIVVETPTVDLVNSVVRAESGPLGESIGIHTDTGGAVRLLGCDVTSLGPAASPVLSAARAANTIPEVEAMCASLAGCVEARGNVDLGCEIDADGHLLTPACVDIGVTPLPVDPPDRLDRDRDGDPRPNGGGYDLGPDEL
ncbi:MAG: putative metal-binding motif-containing protein [Sandaracinaceae bacterium]|nr:putative metal-binding motif-containing protein [Sandaracinaceae bacterium]